MLSPTIGPLLETTIPGVFKLRQFLTYFPCFVSQASVGDVNTERPGFFDMKGKAKHDAWTARKGMPQEEAMQKYIDLTKSMMEKHGTIN